MLAVTSCDCGGRIVSDAAVSADAQVDGHVIDAVYVDTNSDDVFVDAGSVDNAAYDISHDDATRADAQTSDLMSAADHYMNNDAASNDSSTFADISVVDVNTTDAAAADDVTNCGKHKVILDRFQSGLIEPRSPFLRQAAVFQESSGDSSCIEETSLQFTAPASSSLMLPT